MTDEAQAAAPSQLDAFDPQAAFAQCFTEAIAADAEKTTYPIEQWASAGRITKDKPNGEDREWWSGAGGDMVEKWVKLRQASDWVTWDVDGVPALEMNLNFNLAGFLVRASIDWVAVAGGELIVVDKKTGARTPDSDLQLGFYATGLEVVFGERPRWGAYWMARKEMTAPIDLDWCSKELLTETLEAFKRAQDNNVFIAHVASHCKRCGVRDFCKFVGGTRAHELEQ